MKKLVLIFSLFFVTSFSFARIPEEKEVLYNSQNNTGTIVKSNESLNASCVNFTLSCGITGLACGYTSTYELITDILWLDNVICEQQ